MSVYKNEYTIDPIKRKYKKLFISNEKDPVTGKYQTEKQYIMFAGIKYYY